MNITNLEIIYEIKDELGRIKQSKEYFSQETDFTRDHCSLDVISYSNIASAIFFISK